MIASIVRSSYWGANWSEVVTLFSVIVGGLFALWQCWRSCRVSRTEHLNAILERYRDKKMTDMFYRLVNNSSYGGEDSEVFYQGGLRFKIINGKKSPDDDICESDIDSMLTLFSQICYEHEYGTISTQEFAFFCFQIRRTLAHIQFKKYLFDFAEYCGRYGVAFPFLALSREGINVDREHYERVLDLVDRGVFRKVVDKVKEVLP